MKSKIFKKLIAGVGALAMVAQLGFVLPASAATTEKVNVTYEADGDTVKFNAEARFASEITTSTVEPNTTKVEKMTGSGSTKGYGTYLPLTEAETTNKMVNMEFDVCFTGRICYLSIGNGGVRDPEKTGRVLTLGYDANDGKIYTSTAGSAFYGSTEVVGSANAWLHVVANADTTLKTTALKVYNMTEAGDYTNVTPTYQNDEIPFEDSTLSSILGLDFYAPSTVGCMIDNIKMSVTDIDRTVRTVTYNIAGTTTTENLIDGKSPAHVPATSRIGYIFKGWKKDNDDTLLTSENVAALNITADTTFTAVYEVDTTYVQSIESVEFSKSQTTAIGQPDAGETDEYEYVVKVTSDTGDDISDKCTVVWSIIGLDKDDNYVHLVQDTTVQTKAKLTVSSGVSNYYGDITAKVTYDPDNSENDNDNSTQTIKIPYAILGNTTTSNIIPAGGYPVDMNDYADSLIGYSATANSLTGQDLVLNKWSIYGSYIGRTLTLEQDEESGDKYLRFAGSGSTVGVYQWTAQTKQYTIETVVKLPAGASIGVYSNTPNNKDVVAECKVAATSGALEVGSEQIAGYDVSKFYKILISCDPTVGKYCAKVYNEDGTLLGESEPVDNNKGTASMKYLCLYGAYPIDVKSFKVYTDTAQSITINADKEVLKVPEEGEADATLDLSATCTGVGGNTILGDVTWSLEDDIEGVSIAGSGQSAVLTVKKGASGTVVVRATNGSATNTKEITLTTSSNVVSIKGTSSLTIPFSGQAAAVGTYSAQTLNKDGEPIEDDEIVYSFTKKDGSTPLETLPTGITFDSKTGKLSVAAGASSTIIYLKATNKEGLSSKMKINIHGMSFSFGTNEPEDGYVQITADTLYSQYGYGFVSTSGLTNGTSDVTGTSDYTVKVNVPNGNYKVNVTTTSASMTSEAVSGSATGTTKSGSEFNVAVCDEALDLTFAADSKISALQISQIAEKTPNEKPAVFSIGDSTTNNSGHIGGSSYDAATATDHRVYASWGNCVTEDMYKNTFSSYTNSGWAGKNSASYYNLGRLETVLLAIAPGDYVTINMGINSQGDEPYETLMENYYVQGVIQRGGIPVILTHTPDGVGFSNSQSSYDSSTGKFSVSRSDQSRVQFLKSLAEKYNLNLIDVGQWGENYFNSLTTADLGKANTENSILSGYTAPTTVYDLVRSWYPDHNHYTKELGTPIATYIMSQLSDIVENPFDIASVAKTVEDGTVTLTATAKADTAKGEKEMTVYVAQYDSDGVLIKLEPTSVTFSSKTDGLTATATYTQDASAVTTKVFVWDENQTPYLADTSVTAAQSSSDSE